VAANDLFTLAGAPDERARVETALLAAVHVADDTYLTEIASHLIHAGGKRQRPGFTLAAGACVDGYTGPASADVVSGGVAVELVHLGSLYHDDVIDEALTRRTTESVNARWGNLRAILAGDFLLARASEIAAALGAEIAALLANTIAQLCAGELAELQTAYQPTRSRDAYYTAIDGKTAALFAAATRIGAIVAGHQPGDIERLTRFGQAYGRAFQIVDDVLDLTATEEQLGKPVAHDLVEGIYNLPVLHALAGPDGDELAALLGTPIGGEVLEQARSLVTAGDAITAAVREAASECDQAVDQLGPLAATPGGEALVAAADHLVRSVRTG
jgi:heptaprenyl diphosphate synthase